VGGFCGARHFSVRKVFPEFGGQLARSIKPQADLAIHDKGEFRTAAHAQAPAVEITICATAAGPEPLDEA